MLRKRFKDDWVSLVVFFMKSSFGAYGLRKPRLRYNLFVFKRHFERSEKSVRCLRYTNRYLNRSSFGMTGRGKNKKYFRTSRV